jgi:hypothetical protein
MTLGSGLLSAFQNTGFPSQNLKRSDREEGWLRPCRTAGPGPGTVLHSQRTATRVQTRARCMGRKEWGGPCHVDPTFAGSLSAPRMLCSSALIYYGCDKEPCVASEGCVPPSFVEKREEAAWVSSSRFLFSSSHISWLQPAEHWKKTKQTKNRESRWFWLRTLSGRPGWNSGRRAYAASPAFKDTEASIVPRVTEEVGCYQPLLLQGRK